MNNITPFPQTDASLLLWAAPGEPVRPDPFAEPPPRRKTDADEPSGAAVVYLLGAATLVAVGVSCWVLGLLTMLAVVVKSGWM